MYAEVVASGEAFSEFSTPAQLFERYCLHKRRAATQRIGVDQWTEVTGALVKCMSRDVNLSAPWRSLSAWEPYAEELCSEHVLVRSNNRVAFFHENLFDYFFGLNFYADQRLLDWLGDEEQGLFRRAQIRQVLAFRRDDYPKRYLTDLQDLLFSREVRFHLKHLVLNLLGKVSAPNADEAEILSAFIRQSDVTECRHALAATAARSAWFFALRDTVRQLLNSDDNTVRSLAFRWLSRVADKYPDEVADIVAPLVNRGGDWPDTVASFMTLCRGYSNGTRFVDLVVRLVESGAFDQHSIWMWLADAGQTGTTDWSNVYRIVVALLRRNLALTVKRGERVPLEDPLAKDVIQRLAKADPSGFVDALIPVFVQALEGEPQGDNKDAFPDDDYLPASLTMSDRDVWAPILAGLASSMAQLIRDADPKGLQAVYRVSAIGTWTPQLVAAQALTAAEPQAADESVRWLLGDRRRFDLHRWNGVQHSQRLIKVATPECSQALFESLETALCNYYLEYERKTDNRKAFGRSQWMLLSALSRKRMSNAGRRRLDELNRKFGTKVPTKTEQNGPIKPAGIERMSNNDWLGAIARYTTEGEITWNEAGQPKGGAYELAQELQKRAAEEPVRFANLAHQIKPDAPPIYLSAVLAGVKDTGLGVDVLEPLIVRADAIPDKPHGRPILELLMANPSLPWSDAILKMLCWYAMKHRDPEPRHGDDDHPDMGQNVYAMGIESVRGHAARCLGFLVHADASRLPKLRLAINSVVSDRHDAVRSSAAVACSGVLRHDVDAAIQLTETLLRHGGPARGTAPVEQLIWSLLPAYTDRLLPFLAKMLEDSSEKVVAVAARQICLAALSDNRAMELAERCISGNDTQRQAAATILAANINKAAHRTFCESVLSKLFRVPNAEVRKTVASCFRVEKKVDVSEYPELVRAFIKSPAFADVPNVLMDAFKRSTGDCSKLIVAAAQRFLNIAGDEAGNIQSRAALTARNLAPLVFRAYAQSAAASKPRRQCLDIIDRMFLHSVQDIEHAAERVRQ